MMLRIIGAACILGASVLLGIAHSGIFKIRADSLEARAEFFARLREKISYDRSDLAAAMSECASADCGGLGADITKVCSNVKNRGEGFYKAWTATAEKRYLFTEDDIRVIDEFMRAADNGSAESVISAADCAVQKIGDDLKKLREYGEKNKKVFFSLWLYSGIFLVIMLM